MLPHSRGEFAQQPVHLAQFFFVQADQLVVELDGLQRLDEHRGSGAARPVNHAVHAPLAAGHDRHHEPVIANGDEIFLQRSVFVMRAQEARQRFLDLPALPFAVAAQARQHDTRIVRQRAVGKNLAAKIAGQLAQIGDRRGVRRQPRITLARRQHHRSRFGCDIQQPRQLEDFRGFERGSFDPQARDQRRWIGAQVETRPDRRSPAGRLRIRSRAQILDRFGGIGQRVFDRGTIAQRRYALQLALPHGTAHVAAEQRAQILELKRVFGLHQNTPAR